MAKDGSPQWEQDRPDPHSPGVLPELGCPATLGDTLAGMADHLGLVEGLFYRSPVPYSIFGADGHCQLANLAFRAMFGSEPPPAYNIFRDEVAERLGLADSLRRAFEGETVETPVFWYDPKELEHVHVPDARRVAMACSCFPLRGQGGDIRHVVIAYRDATAEWTIRDKEEERLQLLLKAGGLGHWSVDLRTMALTASEGCKANFGLPPDADLSSYEQLRSLVHPEDRLAMAQAVERSIARCEDYIAEYRVLTPEGGIRWVVARGRVVCSDGGTPVEMVGVTVDVTEPRKAEKERERLTGGLAEERGRLRALADTSTALAKATTDFHEALEELARLASEALGECCVLTLLDEEQPGLEVVATYHPDPEARKLLKDTLEASYSNEGGSAMRVIRTGQPVRFAQVSQEGLRSRP